MILIKHYLLALVQDGYLEKIQLITFLKINLLIFTVLDFHMILVAEDTHGK